MKTNDVIDFSNLTHAGQCLDIYLRNTVEIYDRYTIPAIKTIVESVKRNGWQIPIEEALSNLIFWVSWQDGTKKALQTAAKIVKKYDGITLTDDDIKQVTTLYSTYIVNCAFDEIKRNKRNNPEFVGIES